MSKVNKPLDAQKLAISLCWEHRNHPDNHVAGACCVVCEPYAEYFAAQAEAAPAPIGKPLDALLSRLQATTIEAAIEQLDQHFGKDAKIIDILLRLKGLANISAASMTPSQYENLTPEQIKAYDSFGWPRE